MRLPKDKKFIANFYESLCRIRRVEEAIIDIYPSDKIKSPVHLSIGQEAVSVGVCQALKKDDVVFGTYRGHALYLAKGGRLTKMMAELYGKKEGCAEGKGGSMHLIDLSCGVMGTSAIVGTTIPVSVGYAYAMKYKNSSTIVASFFGDGAVDEGAFHEGLNFAALKKLPILFVCENNRYAIHSHHLGRRRFDNICERAASYGIASCRIPSGDIFAIYKKSLDFIKQIRNGGGPAFLECDTCRWKEHVGPGDDFCLGYRTAEEVEVWKKQDPLISLKTTLDKKTLLNIHEKIKKEIKDAFAFAEASHFPRGRAILFRDLFAE